MKRLIPLGPNLVIKADISEKKSSGGIILATEGSREAMAPDIVEIIALGEQANEDLTVKPKVGDKVAIARYDGKTVDTEQDTDGRLYEYRVIADTRILCILE